MMYDSNSFLIHLQDFSMQRNCTQVEFVDLVLGKWHFVFCLYEEEYNNWILAAVNTKLYFTSLEWNPLEFRTKSGWKKEGCISLVRDPCNSPVWTPLKKKYFSYTYCWESRSSSQRHTSFSFTTMQQRIILSLILLFGSLNERLKFVMQQLRSLIG